MSGALGTIPYQDVVDEDNLSPISLTLPSRDEREGSGDEHERSILTSDPEPRLGVEIASTISAGGQALHIQLYARSSSASNPLKIEYGLGRSL